MGTSISVKTDELIRTSESLKLKMEEYKASYEKVYEICGQLFADTSWLGPEAREFNRKVVAFRDDFEYMYTKISDYATFLKKAAKAYDATQSGTQKQADKLITGRE